MKIVRTHKVGIESRLVWRNFFTNVAVGSSYLAAEIMQNNGTFQHSSANMAAQAAHTIGQNYLSTGLGAYALSNVLYGVPLFFSGDYVLANNHSRSARASHNAMVLTATAMTTIPCIVDEFKTAAEPGRHFDMVDTSLILAVATLFCLVNKAPRKGSTPTP